VDAVLVFPVSKQVEKAFRRVLAAVGEPWRLAKRGRKPKRSPKDYSLALFARSFYGFSYRTASAILGIPKSCLHWAFQRLQQPWVQALVTNTCSRLERELQSDSQVLGSTGVSLSANGFKRKALCDSFLKLHALTAYSRKHRAIWFVKAKVTTKHVHDVKPGMQFVQTTPLASTLLGDKAYDSSGLYRLAFKRGLHVCMRQRKNCEWNRGLRGRVYKQYDDWFYKSERGRVEAAFGGFANRYGSRVLEKKFATQTLACLLWAVAHNIRTIAKALVNHLLDSLSKPLVFISAFSY